MRQKVFVVWLSVLFSMKQASSQKHGNSDNYRMAPVSAQTCWAKSVNVGNVLPEYPRPQMMRRRWVNLNGLWEYSITDRTDTNSQDFSSIFWEGKILVPYPIESALSGVKKRLESTQFLWYKRTVEKPGIGTGEKILLHFGAVDFDATVYLNGKQIGNHKGGYQNFSFDVSKELTSGKNELIVKVWDPSDKSFNPHGKQALNPGGIMYTPSSGIWQTVWMETVPADYVNGLEITPDIDNSLVRVMVKSASNTAVEIKADGQTIKAKSNEVISVPVKTPKLWSPDDPYLYDLTVKLGNDKVKSYFGMRKVEIRKDEKGIDRIFLNNKYTYNLGVLDQGFWPEGLYTAPTDEALKYDIIAAKLMGFNTIRKHIKIEPARWYYHADKAGMLVWQDMVNPGKVTNEGKGQFEKECAENIAQLYNHPCITTWVLFNEKWGQYDQERLTKWIKRLDSSRLVNGHSGEMLYTYDELRSPSPNAWIHADMTDVHAYPMPGHIKIEKNKAAVLGEFGGIGVQVQGHLWDDVASGWGYGGTVSGGEMRRQYAKMIDSLVKLEREGLSASIYTQPFDVESEQNGLMTYDREMIKIPFANLRSVHKRLWPATKNYTKLTNYIKAEHIDTAAVNYELLKLAYNNGKRDPVFLRQLAILARTLKDDKISSQAANDYIHLMEDPLSESNLRFIHSFTMNTTDEGFSILYRHAATVNRILGKDMAEQRIIRSIENDVITPHIVNGIKPDWVEIEKEAVSRFGDIGQEAFLQFRVIYTANHQDWNVLGNLISPWFEQYGKKRVGIMSNSTLLNNLAWVVFDHVNDKVGLKTALDMCQQSLAIDESPNIKDTYANLLYKLGKKEEALKWQKKAMAESPSDEAFKSNYEKMLAGQPTWRVSEH